MTHGRDTTLRGEPRTPRAPSTILLVSQVPGLRPGAHGQNKGTSSHFQESFFLTRERYGRHHSKTGKESSYHREVQEPRDWFHLAHRGDFMKEAACEQLRLRMEGGRSLTVDGKCDAQQEG